MSRLQQTGDKAWRYNGTHRSATIKLKRIGLTRRYVISGDSNSPHFGSVDAAYDWLVRNDKPQESSHA
ncbi:MAG: hypothetical protein OIF55_19185 [Amphritea sp.]|nr:hypothetical protein [Amphritea sp.]